jgi:hypothetical protein
MSTFGIDDQGAVMSHPPARSALPDLAPLGVTIQFHPDGSAFDLQYLITNGGDAPAPGGFQIGLTAQYRDHSQDPAETVDISDLLTFPPNVFIEPGDIVPSGYLLNIPFRPNKLDTEYPKVAYVFECTVDVENQVAESNKQNNSVQNAMSVGLPLIILPPVGPLQQ